MKQCFHIQAWLVSFLLMLGLSAGTAYGADACGNGFCDGPPFETCQTCPLDCGRCPSPPRFLRGDLLDPQGSGDSNACVENVIDAVNTLRNRGETMGFYDGPPHPPVDNRDGRHWQGIQRLPIIPGTGLDKAYIVVSSNHDGQPSPFSRSAVVELATRDGDGLRFRSNRLLFGALTRDVYPDPSDRVVHSEIITREYKHPGGMQAIGKYLLVGSERQYGHLRPTAPFSLWDMSDPLAPRKGWEWELDVAAANSVGIVRLADGRYLMLRALGDAKNLEFYVLGRDLEKDPARWNYRYMRTEGPDGDREWADLDCGILGTGKAGYQNTNMVKECGTGTLYLIASHGRCPGQRGGGDFVDAFRLDISALPGKVVITKVAKRHMFPGDNADDRQGDLQAAAGAYVGPDNKLYFYATEHGHATDPLDFVEMIEFSPQEPRSQANAIEEAWVELYEHDDYDGRSIILDYVDRDLRDYDNFDRIEQYDNIASSVIYAIPIGSTLRLYEHDNGGGGYFDLVGTGRATRIADLGAARLSNGKSAEDQFSSAAWIRSCFLPNDLAAWYPFDEMSGSVAADSIDSNDGIHVNGPKPVSGVDDYALRFDGVDDYVEVPDSDALDVGTGDFSVDFWIQTSQRSGVHVIQDKRRPTSPYTGYHVYLAGGKIGIQLADTKGYTNYTSPAFVADGTPHFVAISVDRDGIGTVYLDGVKTYTFDPTGHPLSLDNDMPLRFGRRSFSSFGSFQGTLDEFELVRRALSASEVKDIYTLGNCKSPSCKSAGRVCNSGSECCSGICQAAGIGGINVCR